jgi:hypothetical protein
MQLKKSTAHILRKACMAAGLRMAATGSKKNLRLQKHLTGPHL